jgi:predicted nucleic acid-binding OB-fold protein
LRIKYEDIVRYIKTQRIRLIGHIVRMNEERTVERKTDWRPIAVRIGRNTLR